ncbi:MAG: SGNH/GDSL hydrolase family protein [Clostridia bacterium]|nr:SGNH/GDSL hydrolase family protein [Clostridia bacterium]
MRIEDIDKNLSVNTDITEPDLVWLDAKNSPFSLHGVFYDAKQKQYVRMPQDVADSISKNIGILSKNTAGGRIRFRTDSSFIAIRAVMKPSPMMPHFTLAGQSGFDLYRKNAAGKEIYYKTFLPPMGMTEGYSSPVTTDGTLTEYTINFPLYDDVHELYIALKKDSILEAPTPYSVKKPVVFYGSSITQGGCASRPGNSYQAMLSRRLDMDFIILGFSGSARGEPEMARYLGEVCKTASAFVCNYDWNAAALEHLERTHLPLYRAVREANPDLPILLLSEPEFVLNPAKMLPRLEVIRKTYFIATSEGDENIWFLPGNTIYEGDHWDTCTVDGCHPNDLGFYRMAMAMEPYLRKMLSK